MTIVLAIGLSEAAFTQPTKYTLAPVSEFEDTGSAFMNRTASAYVLRILAKYLTLGISEHTVKEKVQSDLNFAQDAIEEIREKVPEDEIHLSKTRGDLDPFLYGFELDELKYRESENAYYLPIYRDGKLAYHYKFYIEGDSKDADMKISLPGRKCVYVDMLVKDEKLDRLYMMVRYLRHTVFKSLNAAQLQGSVFFDLIYSAKDGFYGQNIKDNIQFAEMFNDVDNIGKLAQDTASISAPEIDYRKLEKHQKLFEEAGRFLEKYEHKIEQLILLCSQGDWAQSEDVRGHFKTTRRNLFLLKRSFLERNRFVQGNIVLKEMRLKNLFEELFTPENKQLLTNTLNWNVEKGTLVSCSPHLLSIVIETLAENADKAYAEAGKKGEIEITAVKDKENIVISVKDEAAGIRPEIIDKIFDLDFSTRGEGKGLGLALAKTIIQDHGGTIEVESELGKGATFTIKLPIVKTNSKPARKMIDIASAFGEFRRYLKEAVIERLHSAKDDKDKISAISFDLAMLILSEHGSAFKFAIAADMLTIHHHRQYCKRVMQVYGEALVIAASKDPKIKERFFKPFYLDTPNHFNDIQRNRNRLAGFYRDEEFALEFVEAFKKESQFDEPWFIDSQFAILDVMDGIEFKNEELLKKVIIELKRYQEENIALNPAVEFRLHGLIKSLKERGVVSGERNNAILLRNFNEAKKVKPLKTTLYETMKAIQKRGHVLANYDGGIGLIDYAGEVQELSEAYWYALVEGLREARINYRDAALRYRDITLSSITRFIDETPEYEKNRKCLRRGIPKKKLFIMQNSERVHAAKLKDTTKLIQAEKQTKPIIFAFGTSWIKAYERYSGRKFRYLQGQDLNKLITSITGLSTESGINFIADTDDALLGRISEIEDYEDAKIVVLAGKETITSDSFKTLRDNADNTLVGVNNENLSFDSYIRLVEMLNLTLKLAFGMDADMYNVNIDINPITDSHGNVLYYIFTPNAEPMDYEDLKDLYKIQIFA
jgi:signal transduction histidine kinase